MTRGRRRWLWLVLAVPLAVGLGRLRFDTEVLHLLPDTVPVVRGLQLYQEHFANTRELVITVRAADSESAATAARLIAEGLRNAPQLVASATWQAPWIEDPEQMAELLAYLWLNQRPAAFAALTNRLAPESLRALALESREQLATSLSPVDIGRLGYDPFGFTRLPPGALEGARWDSPEAGFASADGSFRAVFVEAPGPLPDYGACVAWLAAVQSTVDQVTQDPGWPPDGIRVRYTGAPAFVAEIASSMASDLRFTVLTTLALIVLLFWWAHRSWRPLAWLVVMLALVMTGALAAGGLVFGTLNAISLGFGAILLGLAVDCGLVVYQEAAAEPHRSAATLRRTLVPSVLWSALTTAAAFLLLNFAGLPGLSQLGTIVGIGVLLAPVVMLYLYLPLALRWLQHHPPRLPPQRSHPTDLGRYRALTVIAAASALLALAWTRPTLDRSNRPLEPRNGAAQGALDELQTTLSQPGEPLLLVISGRDEQDVAARLEFVQAHLENARRLGAARGLLMPTALWPAPDRQDANRAGAAAMARHAGTFREAAREAGFAPEALGLTERILQDWAESENRSSSWPTNRAGQWLLKRAAAWTGSEWLATGAVYPSTNAVPLSAAARQLDPERPGIWLTGWPLLGENLFQHVERRVRWLVVAIVGVVALCLRLAFRRWLEVIMSFGALVFMLLILQALMAVTGISWNLMSLAAIPLLVGVGVDYIIHVQIALRRHHGDVGAMRQVTGRAILLCAATNVDGFGSNAMSSNPGLASLGLVCALGISVAYLTAVFLVPAWWRRFAPEVSIDPCEPQVDSASAPAAASAQPRLNQPSAAYGPGPWRLGLRLVRWLPDPVLAGVAWVAATIYRTARPARVAIATQNLLPVFAGDRRAARQASRGLFSQFARKLVDLWRYESGAPVSHWIARWSGRERLDRALARRRGVLLVTIHIGNWEFGGPFLKATGIPLLVVTQPEPGEGFTEMRQASRARWGIETLVVRHDPFAFVEIIKRLQAGALVAVLLDRPPPPTAVRVSLFGQPLDASVSAALLARATGASLLPVYVVHEAGGYGAHILPEIEYDRAALGTASARQRLTQEILRAFEPVIRQYPDQWYHFVPIWPVPDEPPGPVLEPR